MSHGNVHYLYYLDGWGYYFVPQQANRVNGTMELSRNCYHTIRLQAVRTTDFSLQSDLSAPSTALPDWPNFTGAVWGLKTETQFNESGDYTAAWSGFDTGDTEWHSPADKRYSFAVAPTHATATGVYLHTLSLTDGSVTMKLPDIPLRVPVIQEGIVGDEPTVPSGISSNSGTAIIPDGTDSVVVSFTDMTSGGLIIPFWIGSAQSTISAIAGTDQFTIQSGGPVDGDTTVGYYVVKSS